MNLREQYETDGFVVVPSGVGSVVLGNAIEDCARVVKDGSARLQPRQYHYSDGPRVFELWKSSQAVRDIAYAPSVVEAIKELSGAVPRPAQVISMAKGSQQPLHMDAIHFSTSPEGRMIAVWTALEDIDEESGPLLYVPGSHVLPAWDFGHLGLMRTKNGEQFENYHRYEEFVARVAAPMRKERFVGKAGDTFIWGLNLIHGGAPILDPKKTRNSQVTHYYLPPLERAFAPMIEDPEVPGPFLKSCRWFDRAGQLHPIDRNRVRPLTSYGS